MLIFVLGFHPPIADRVCLEDNYVRLTELCCVTVISIVVTGELKLVCLGLN